MLNHLKIIELAKDNENIKAGYEGVGTNMIYISIRNYQDHFITFRYNVEGINKSLDTFIKDVENIDQYYSHVPKRQFLRNFREFIEQVKK